MQTASLAVLLAWALCATIQSVGGVYYCPENDETLTVTLTAPIQIRTVYAVSNTYRRNQNCRWILDAGADSNNRIQVVVTESDMQWTLPNTNCYKYDYIELRNGKKSTSNLVKTWCGGVTPYTVISPGNVLFVSFVSDDIHLSEKKGVTLDISVFSVDPATGACPLGWVSDPVSPMTSCYDVKTHAETWKDAQGFCQNDQANLVSLSDAQQETFVLAEAKSAISQSSQTPGSIWIGLNDIVKEGQYVWVDGVQDPTSFSSSKVPISSELYKDCMLVGVESGDWAEDHCHRPEARSTAKHPFVCERKKDGTTVSQPSPPVEAVTYYCKADGKILFISSAESARIQTREEGTSSYGNNLNCRWIINSGRDLDKRIHIKVTRSDLQWTPSDAICYGYDNIQVKNGPDEDSPTLSTFCGNMNPYTLTSSSNVLYIVFKSNDRSVYNHAGATLDFSFFTVAAGIQECPPGWFSDSPTGTYCYSIKTHAETWVQAQQFCNNDQANLVSLETAAEEKFVTDYAIQTLFPLRIYQIWIGLNDIVKEGDMVWIDGAKETASTRFNNFGKSSADTSSNKQDILVDDSLSSSSYTSSVFEDCVLVQLRERRWEEEFCTNAEVQTTSKYPFVCKRKRDGSTPIYPIPRASAEKEGKKKSLPPKAAIIMGTIAAILVVVGLGAGIVYCYNKKRAASAAEAAYISPVRRSSPLHANIPPTQLVAPTAHMATHSSSTDDPPPSYEDVAKVTPI